MKAMLRMSLAVAVGAGALLAGGCGTYAKQTQSKIDEATSAVDVARNAGAESAGGDAYKSAAVNLDAAKGSYASGDYEMAQLSAHKAVTDAQLAVANVEQAKRGEQLAALRAEVGGLESEKQELEKRLGQ